MMDKKDVATKLSNWKDIVIADQDYDIQFLIQLQKQLQYFFKKNSHGKNGKKFYDYQTVSTWSQALRVQCTKQNILRLFDQLTQIKQWQDCPGFDQTILQNIMFQLVDMLHFAFNIVSAWQLQQRVKVPSFDEQVKDASQLLSPISRLLSCIPWKHWKNYVPRDVDSLGLRINVLIKKIFNMARQRGYIYQDIYKMYVSKNAQNANRQMQRDQYKN